MLIARISAVFKGAENMKVTLGLVALALLCSAPAVAQVSFSAETFYRELEPEIKEGLSKAAEMAEAERKRKIAAGLPPISAGNKRLGEKGIRSVLYYVAVRKTTCFEQALKQERDYQTTVRLTKDCLEDVNNELLKFNKMSDYASAISPLKSARCEMKSRDYKNEIRFPPFDFLLTPGEPAPRLMDYKMLSECLLAD